jgi:hypothetical protein
MEMRNPWLKKNPFLSMWLSGANAMLGVTNAAAMSAVQRQTQAMMNETARAVVDFWAAGMPTPQRPRRKARSRKHR